MKILICTNAYPQTGEAARSLRALISEYRALGHHLLIAAPQGFGAPTEQEGVLRLPIAHAIPTGEQALIPDWANASLQEFAPDVVQAQHPLLLGGVALRIAAQRNVPVVFTHQARCECGEQQVPFNSPVLQRMFSDLIARYCNLCDAVIVPTQRTASLLRQQGVSSPIVVIPTSGENVRFVQGEGEHVRAELGIPQDAFVVGLTSDARDNRSSAVLTDAIGLFLARDRRAHLLLFCRDDAQQQLSPRLRPQLRLRTHCIECRRHAELQTAYAAMDVLAACGPRPDRQVLVEALSAGVPVIATDDPDSRELIEDGKNGRLLPRLDADSLAAALEWIANLGSSACIAMHAAIQATAQHLMTRESALRMVELYAHLIERRRACVADHQQPPPAALGWVDEEIKILSNMAGALGDALLRA